VGHLDQQPVVDRVPVRVVDQLEVVEVAEQHDAALAPFGVQVVVQRLEQAGAVADAGQRVDRAALVDLGDVDRDAGDGRRPAVQVGQHAVVHHDPASSTRSACHIRHAAGHVV
jgi:hypothetical protein